MSEYKIIKHTGISELEKAVNDYLAKGYQISGSLVAVIARETNGTNSVEYLQAIFKP